MSRFGCYALLALIALTGPRWVVGVASAAYRVTLTADDDAAIESAVASAEGAQAPAQPSAPVRINEEFRPLGELPAQHGAGSAGSVSSSFSPGGMPGALSEVPAPPVPFVTLLRQSHDRVAAISRPSPVFEPPRVG